MTVRIIYGVGTACWHGEPLPSIVMKATKQDSLTDGYQIVQSTHPSDGRRGATTFGVRGLVMRLTDYPKIENIVGLLTDYQRLAIVRQVTTRLGRSCQNKQRRAKPPRADAARDFFFANH